MGVRLGVLVALPEDDFVLDCEGVLSLQPATSLKSLIPSSTPISSLAGVNRK